MGWRDVLRPFRDPDARRYIEYQLLWNAAIGLSSAFFAIHMLENLGMGFTLVAVHGAAVALVRTLMAPVWGRALDRFGARPVLIACSWAIAVIPLVWLPARPGFLWPLVLDAMLSGVLWSGHALAAFELPLSITSRTSRPFYLAAFATAGGVAFSVASLIGGTMASVLPAQLAPAAGRTCTSSSRSPPRADRRRRARDPDPGARARCTRATSWIQACCGSASGWPGPWW